MGSDRHFAWQQSVGSNVRFGSFSTEFSGVCLSAPSASPQERTFRPTMTRILWRIIRPESMGRTMRPLASSTSYAPRSTPVTVPLTVISGSRIDFGYIGIVIAVLILWLLLRD
jgi:hypothetical protein